MDDLVNKIHLKMKPFREPSKEPTDIAEINVIEKGELGLYGCYG